ncbi:MAG: hemerythrin domain-containing protein [Bacteroidales bacterium]|nr:hemerythrin domain-containing protein [Bacteroidales bacterium]
MTTNRTIFTAKTKMAEIITDYSLLTIIDRLNIKLGFGDASIDEICRRHNLSTDLFLMICRVYAIDGFAPDISNLTNGDIPKLIGYLQRTHKYWIESFFPNLHINIHTMLESCDERSAKILNKFYDDYDDEIQKHLDYEENTVFPYIISLGEGKKDVSNKFCIKDFEENHSNIEEKLHDLKNIVIKYLPENASQQSRINVLNEIFKIENDLNKHSVIENKILIPLVSKYE